jgi:hypothetical protein
VAVTIFFNSSTQFKPLTVYVREYNGPPAEQQRLPYQRFVAKTVAKTCPRIQASIFFTILRHEFVLEVLKVITGSSAMKIIFGPERE